MNEDIEFSDALKLGPILNRKAVFIGMRVWITESLFRTRDNKGRKAWEPSPHNPRRGFITGVRSRNNGSWAQHGEEEDFCFFYEGHEYFWAYNVVTNLYHNYHVVLPSYCFHRSHFDRIEYLKLTGDKLTGDNGELLIPI